MRQSVIFYEQQCSEILVDIYIYDGPDVKMFDISVLLGGGGPMDRPFSEQQCYETIANIFYEQQCSEILSDEHSSSIFCQYVKNTGVNQGRFYN